MIELFILSFSYLIAVLLLPLFLNVPKDTLKVKNYRGNFLLNSTGVWLSLLLVLGSLPLLFWYNSLPILWFVALSISFIGLLDDLFYEKAKGLKGHLLRLKDGVITTGVLKLVFIFIVAFGLAIVTKREYWYIDASLISLLANTENTLDTRPTRALKFYILIFLFVFYFSKERLFRSFAFVFLGVIIAFTPYEKKEVVMLGDAGSNLLGVVLGLVFWGLPLKVRIASIILCLLWQIFADRYSLSKLLDLRKER